MKKQEIRYTVVLHDPRLELKLSVAEYCIADSVYHLSNNPSSKVQGGCYASKETLADFIGITPRAVYNILNKLIRIGLVDKDEDTKHLRTTQLGYDKVVLMELKTEYEKSSHSMNKVQKGCEESSVGGMKKVHSDYEKSSHYNNTITISNNNIDNNTSNSKELQSQELVIRPKKEKSTIPDKTMKDTIDKGKAINPLYKDGYGNITQRKSIERLLTDKDIDESQIKGVIDNLEKIASVKFMPNISTPHLLLKNWSALVSQIKKQSLEKKGGINVISAIN